MTTLDVLKAARERISDPSRWCQQRLRIWSYWTRNEAVAWCAVGAVLDSAEEMTPTGPLASRAMAALSAKVAPMSLPYFNDTHSHVEVLALFDRAIAAEEQS